MTNEIQNIATALIKAQNELTNPDKNQDGYGYKYADLASILDKVKPVLERHDLAITQLATDDGNGRVGVTTILMHKSGESFSSELTLPIPDMKGANSTQAAGAAITYARRYAISAILNIAADEDTDGQGSAQKNSTKQKSLQGNITDKQLKAINTMMAKSGTDRDKVKEYYKVNSLKDLTKEQASELFEKLQKKLEQ